MTLALVTWVLSVVLAVIFYVCISSTIEKSGESRLGATGNLFTCDPDRHPKK